MKIKNSCLGATLLLMAACQIPTKPVPTVPTEAIVGTSGAQNEPPRNGATAPALSPAEAKRQSHALSLQAAVLLDEGREAEARDTLRSALALDEQNVVAAKLQMSMDADPEKELGSKFFRYTVKAGDRLSKIAEQFLGDQYRFYLLARYNGIEVPRGLKAEQVIKVPGTRPPTAETGAEEGLKPLKEGKPAGRSTSADALQDCGTLWTAGERERALLRCEEAVNATPRDPQAVATYEGRRSELVLWYERRAREAYRKQDLDACIGGWGKVLQFDAAHESAARERDRCVRLKRELDKSSK